MWRSLAVAFGIVVTIGILGSYVFFHYKTSQPPTSVIKEFYADINRQDLDALNALFVPAVSEEDKSVKSRLFTGRDLDGTPGGPTIGQTNSASYHLLSYAVEGNEGLLYRVTERREYLGGTHDVHVSVELVQVGMSWRLKTYQYRNGDGAYSAFLLE